jgi:hypothetical protein
MQRTRFGSAYNPYLVQQLEEAGDRVEIFTPVRGLHQGDAPSDLEAGFSPIAYNFVIDAGHITPRFGLSSFKGGVSQLSGPALGAYRAFDLKGNQFLVAASDRTIALFDPVSDEWRALSAHTSDANVPSGTSRQYWRGAHIYDSVTDEAMCVFTNQKDLPKTFQVTGSVATYSDLTDFASLASYARAVCAFDNRLVWWNVGSSTQSQPQRVLWSARGKARNYQLIDGAGFEDLLDISGVGTGIIAEREGVLLFSENEVWRGRRRGDAYVFDFYPIARDLGCPYPNTIVMTPIGTVFLGRDLELYAVQGDAIQAIGPRNMGEASRIRTFLQDNLYEADRSWAAYNPTEQRYELFFTGTDSANGYPTRGLFYSLAERAFFPQRFQHELTMGVDYINPGDPQMWDTEILAWDNIATSWDEQMVAGNGYEINAFTSGGTGARFDSSITNDLGSSFTCEWTSHALNRNDQMRMERLNELWIEYRATSAGNASVEFSGDLGFDPSDTFDLALPAGSYQRVLVPANIAGAAPHFKILVTDGSTPKIARFQARLLEAGAYGGVR